MSVYDNHYKILQIRYDCYVNNAKKETQLLHKREGKLKDGNAS